MSDGTSTLFSNGCLLEKCQLSTTNEGGGEVETLQKMDANGKIFETLQKMDINGKNTDAFGAAGCQHEEESHTVISAGANGAEGRPVVLLLEGIGNVEENGSPNNGSLLKNAETLFSQNGETEGRNEEAPSSLYRKLQTRYLEQKHPEVKMFLALKLLVNKVNNFFQVAKSFATIKRAILDRKAIKSPKTIDKTADQIEYLFENFSAKFADFIMENAEEGSRGGKKGENGSSSSSPSDVLIKVPLGSNNDDDEMRMTMNEKVLEESPKKTSKDIDHLFAKLT
jgi:hypothetical protein